MNTQIANEFGCPLPSAFEQYLITTFGSGITLLVTEGLLCIAAAWLNYFTRDILIRKVATNNAYFRWFYYLLHSAFLLRIAHLPGGAVCYPFALYYAIDLGSILLANAVFILYSGLLIQILWSNNKSKQKTLVVVLTAANLVAAFVVLLNYAIETAIYGAPPEHGVTYKTVFFAVAASVLPFNTIATIFIKHASPNWNRFDENTVQNLRVWLLVVIVSAFLKCGYFALAGSGVFPLFGVTFAVFKAVAYSGYILAVEIVPMLIMAATYHDLAKGTLTEAENTKLIESQPSV